MTTEPTHAWVVVAAYNEAAVIEHVVASVVRAGHPVVVVDDGSRDATRERARAGGATAVLRHAVNLGQGAALQTGIDYALRRGADAIVTFDADGQHSVGDIPALLAALATHDIVLGSRFLGTVEGADARRMMLLRAAVTMSNRLAGLRLTDAHCGLRAFRASAAPRLRITQDRMAHASELLRNVQRSGLSFTEVPITIRYTDHSKQKGQTGFQAIRILFDYFFRAS